MGKVKHDCEVSILLTENEEIQTLNHIYRKINKPTDVLAFSMREVIDEDLVSVKVKETDLEDCLLGDIVISTEMTEIQAKENGHSFEKELIILIIHGLLHLLGFDHEAEKEREIMQVEEKLILEKIEKDIGIN